MDRGPRLRRWIGHEKIFLGLLLFSLISDVLDGYLARKLNASSAIGAKLDSWGDMATYLTVPFCAWWLYPDLVIKEAVFVIIVLTSYIIPIFASLLKFKNIASYHTWGAKFSAVIMALSILTIFVTGLTWPFRVAVFVQVAASLEEIFITIQLSELKSNVKSLWHMQQGKKLT